MEGNPRGLPREGRRPFKPQTVLLHPGGRPWVRSYNPTPSESRHSCGVDLGEIDYIRRTEQSLKTMSLAGGGCSSRQKKVDFISCRYLQKLARQDCVIHGFGDHSIGSARNELLLGLHDKKGTFNTSRACSDRKGDSPALTPHSHPERKRGFPLSFSYRLSTSTYRKFCLFGIRQI